MRRTGRAIALLMLTGTAAISAACATEPVGGLGGPSSQALAVNDAGLVVGWAATTDGPRHAFAQTAGGSVTDIHAGAGESAALAVNAGGTVVGWRGVDAFRWEAGAGMVALGDLGATALAEDVNDTGLVVGTTHTGTNNIEGGSSLNAVAVRWPAGATTPEQLPRLVPGGRTAAHAVNAGGDIVGAALAADGHDHAVLWPAGTSAVVDLGVVGQPSRAFDINDVGRIVGTNGAGEGVRAALWTGTPRQLFILGSFDVPSRATAINNTDRIVGTQGDSGLHTEFGRWVQRGVVWDGPDFTTFRRLSPPPGSEGSLHTIEATGLNDHDLAVGFSAYLLQPGVMVAQRIPLPT